MKVFNGLEKFAQHLKKVVGRYNDYEKKASNFLGEILERDAKATIGHLQEGAGPIPSWEPLADSTKKDKERLGYVFNEQYNPLYRMGDLRDSISYLFEMARHILFLGSSSDIMVYQELGTARIPPRSVLALTLFKSIVLIEAIYQKMLRDWICDQPLRFLSATQGMR